MDETRFDQSLKSVTRIAGRRGALRSLGAAGVAALAAMGIASGEAKKNRGNGGNHHKNDRRAGTEKKGGKRGPTGPTGPTGPAGGGTGAGATGPTGPTGPAAARSLPKVKFSELVQGSLQATATVDCDAGWHAVGGGYTASASSGVEYHVESNFPLSDANRVPRGWQAKVIIAGSIVGALGVSAYAICEPD